MTCCNNIDTCCSLVKQNYLNYILKKSNNTFGSQQCKLWNGSLLLKPRCMSQFTILLLKSVVILVLTTEINF